MALVPFSSIDRNCVFRGVAAALGFALLVVACGSQGDDTVGTSSAELHVSCTSTEVCPTETSQSACVDTPGCGWTGSCVYNGWCGKIKNAAQCADLDGGGSDGCAWVDGVCTQAGPCPTGEVTSGTCIDANRQCTWTPAPAGRNCVQWAPCPSGLTTEAACVAANPQCRFGVSSGSGSGGCTSYCGKVCC